MLPNIANKMNVTVNDRPCPVIEAGEGPLVVCLNGASFEFRRLFNGRIDVLTLGIRGNVDGCIPEVAWELTSPKSFRAGLTLEVMPGDIGHFRNWKIHSGFRHD
jgi:hypothetical protein